MDKDYLVLKRAAASRLSGEWSEDDYDVLADGVVVGRIMKSSRSARRNAMAVDAGLWPPRRPHADLRLRGDPRGRDGSVRPRPGGTNSFSSATRWEAPVGRPGDPVWVGSAGRNRPSLILAHHPSSPPSHPQELLSRVSPAIIRWPRRPPDDCFRDAYLRCSAS